MVGWRQAGTAIHPIVACPAGNLFRSAPHSGQLHACRAPVRSATGSNCNLTLIPSFQNRSISGELN